MHKFDLLKPVRRGDIWHTTKNCSMAASCINFHFLIMAAAFLLRYQSILFQLHWIWNFEEYVQDRIVKGLEPAVSEGYREHISNFRSELVGLIEILKAKKLEIDTIKKDYDEEIIKIADGIISLYSKTKGCVKYSHYSNNLNLIVKLLAYINRDRIIDNIIEEAQNLLVEEQMQVLEKTNDISADDGIDINYYSNILDLTDGGYSLRLKTKKVF